VAMFLIHLVFFHGGQDRILAEATSLENPKGRVFEGHR
jgi:hypothetical protein